MSNKKSRVDSKEQRIKKEAQQAESTGKRITVETNRQKVWKRELEKELQRLPSWLILSKR